LKITPEQFAIMQEQAKHLGFPEMKAAPAGPVANRKTFEDWVDHGFHAEMGWFSNNLERRMNPKLVFEKAKSVLMLLAPHYRQEVRLAGRNLARYAAGDDYHDVLKKRLKSLCRLWQENFSGSDYRVYVDSGPIAERYWAEKSGLGWIGKNGNLIHKREGSYLFLACILTDLELPSGSPHPNHCGSCTACLEACPTQAFVGPGVVNSNKCISYLTIEHRGEFKATTTFKDWIFGCDICQEVCPWNRKSSNWSVLDAFQPRPHYIKLNNTDLKEMSDETFRETFRKSPIKRTKLEGLKRNLVMIEHPLGPAAP